MILKPAFKPLMPSRIFQMFGHYRYTPEIRNLYYNLLASQVLVSKIIDIIRTVLKCFNPSLNVEQQIRIEDTHKAHIIWQRQKLNTDGTTKQQKKSGDLWLTVVLSDELPDGKAISTIEDILNI